MSIHTQIIESLVEYEQQHRVEEYEVYGWHVWPYLRIATAFEFLSGGTNAPPKENVSTRGFIRNSRVYRYLEIIRRIVHPYLHDLRKFDHPAARNRDVVLLTHSNGREQLGKALCHRSADPLFSFLRKKNISLLVWEQGPGRYPRQHPTALITSPLCVNGLLLRRLFGKQPPSAPPTWFAEFQTWASNLLKRDVTWEEWDGKFRYVEQMSRLFQRWLERTRCRCLIIECWYSGIAMAATLAALRLGIPTVEIQHGHQGPTHFAYVSWTRKPHGGYEVIPETFWTWGTEDATAVPANERPGKKVFVGGNLWMNLWRDRPDSLLQQSIKDACALSAGWAKSILVTQQHGVDLKPVLEAIRRSPKNWRWLIRIRHGKNEATAKNIKDTLQTLDHPGVNVEDATQMPLYALMQACDVHVTGFSTCALEALAFGKPTVLFYPTGRDAFRKYIDAGVMSYADNGERLLDNIKQAEQITAADCKTVAEPIFASSDNSERSLDEFLRQTLT